MTPMSRCTLSLSTSLRALVSVVAGLPSLSSRTTSTLRPAICQPLSCQNSSQHEDMSWPAAAMAPDSGERNPILIGPWALASPSAARDTATPTSSSHPIERMRDPPGEPSLPTLILPQTSGRSRKGARRANAWRSSPASATLGGARQGEAAHGDRSPAAQSDDARGQALLGRPARAQADAAPVRGVRPRVLVSAGGLPEVLGARHRLDPVERARHAALLRDRLPVVQQGVQGAGPLRAGDGRAGRGAADAVEPGQRRTRSQEDPV